MNRSGFWIRKAERAAYYFRFVFGWKKRPCSACNGSGRYDHNGSPKCGACNGTGVEAYRGGKWLADAMEVHAPHLADIMRKVT